MHDDQGNCGLPKLRNQDLVRGGFILLYTKFSTVLKYFFNLIGTQSYSTALVIYVLAVYKCTMLNKEKLLMETSITCHY
jgi:hypothetical protein